MSTERFGEIMASKGGKDLAGGLIDYGGAGFAAYLRRSFARSMGYSPPASSD